VNAFRAALDTSIASDIPLLAKAFFVTLFALALAIAMGSISGFVAWAMRALPRKESR
jgi:ABC-type amino acid transport system permease subunit